jgi:maltose O-acetyltransferase
VPIIGNPCEKLKEYFVKKKFKSCGKNVNVSQDSRFGNGKFIEIGSNSSIGMNCKVPNNICIGEDVMMRPYVTIYGANHIFERTEIPMRKQGMKKYPPVIIEDDVWIASHAIIMPTLTVAKGTIIGAAAVVTKNFPEFSIIAGNPAKLIKSRL